jgi:type III restriction enzyme
MRIWPCCRNCFNRITCVEDGQRWFNTLYDQSAIRASVRMAFHTHRELHSREETIEQAADLLLVNKLKDIPEHALLWPDQEKCRTILDTDAQPAAKPNDAALLEQKKREIEKIAEDLGNPGIAESMIRKLMEAEAVRTASLDTKDRTLHYLPYDFRQSRFEKTFIETALNLADVRNAGLEIYYNGESSLTDFRIDCYARTRHAWRRVGFYTPDFLIIQRDQGSYP